MECFGFFNFLVEPPALTYCIKLHINEIISKYSLKKFVLVLIIRYLPLCWNVYNLSLPNSYHSHLENSKINIFTFFEAEYLIIFK